jgi:hypothetical protein
MDIDWLARRASEQLATQPSRRGIVTRVAQLAGGAGALVAGLRGFGEAGAEDIKIGHSCCTGVGPCPRKKGERRRCPKNSEVGWTWFCTKPNGARYLCKDCYDESGEDVCVYARKQ